MIKQTREQFSKGIWEINTIHERLLQSFRVITLTTFTFLFILIIINSLNSIRFLSWVGGFSIVLSLLSGFFVLFQLLFLRQIRASHISSNIPNTSNIKTFPLTDAKTVLQRKTLVKEIYAKLGQGDTTSVILAGIAGSGKSTLAALIYRYVEEQRLLSSKPFSEESLWINVSENATMTDLGQAIYSALGKPNPNFSSLAPRDQAIALFNAMDMVENPRLIVLDQFDNLLDWQLGSARKDQPGIGEWLDALNSQSCKCRVLFTSRLSLKGTRRSPLVYIQELSIEGLNTSEGIELLCKKGLANLQAAPEDLRKIVQRYSGHPLALTHIASILKSNQQLRINVFFEYKDILAQSGGIFDLIQTYVEKLELVQRKLLFAFSVYREAMPIGAALAIFEETPKKSILSALDVLLLQHLVQTYEKGSYQVHPIVTNYALKHFQDNNQAKQEALTRAHLRAAQYYKEHFEIFSREELCQELKNFHLVVEAIWHLCHAGQWKEAYELMKTENVFQELKRWGENDTLLDLCQLLLPLAKQNPTSIEAIFIYTDLGRIYRTFGRRGLALEYFNKALSICERQHQIKEGGMLQSLIGIVYFDLGQSSQAMSHLEKALSIRNELGDQEGKAWTLYNLARVYHEQGDEELARQHCKNALVLFRQVKNHKGEIRVLNLLGRIYEHLGKKEQAFNFFEEANAISENVKDRLGEALTLNGLALYYLDLGDKEYALELLEEALKIRQEISDRAGEGRTLNDLGRFYRIVGKKEQAVEYLKRALNVCREIEDYEGISKTLNNLSMLQSDEQAQESLKEALQICKRIGDRRVEGWTLHNMGRVSSNLGDLKNAERCYKQALRIRRDIGDRRGEGWTLYNLGRLYVKESKYEQALAFFQVAKDVFHEIKNSNLADTQTDIENLQHKIGEKEYAELNKSLRPRAHITIEQILSEDN